MSHLETYPHTYDEGVTYAPVRWHLADLAEKCHYDLTHPDEASAIVEATRRALGCSFTRDGFLGDVVRCLPLA